MRSSDWSSDVCSSDLICRGTSIGRLAAVHAVGGKSAAARARGTPDAVLAHQQATVACPGNGAIPVAQGQDVVPPSEKQVFPGHQRFLRTDVALDRCRTLKIGIPVVAYTQKRSEEHT